MRAVKLPPVLATGANITGNIHTSLIGGSLSPLHGASLHCGWRNGAQYGG